MENLLEQYNLFYMMFINDNMEVSDELLKEIVYVKISGYRTNVLKSLEEDFKIPSVIAKEAGIRLNHISKVLAQLKDHGLIECINPEVSKGRLYKLTETGEDVVKNLECFKI